MTQVNEHLWTRDSHAYYVEGRVGNAWTKLTDVGQDRTKIVAAMHEHLKDPSIHEVRLVELTTRVQATIVEKHDSLIEMKPEQKLRPTDRRAECPGCKSDVPVMHDGTHSWASCPACNRVVPV